MKIPGSIKFFIISIIIYLIIFLVNPSLSQNAWEIFVGMLIKIIPLLFLIFLIMFFVNYLVKPEKIKKYFGKQAGIKTDFYATVAGILVSGPPYVLFPMLGDLKKHGMSNRALSIFLYNRNVKIPYIPVMIFYFGFAYTIIVSLLIILFSFIGARILEIFVKE